MTVYGHMKFVRPRNNAENARSFRETFLTLAERRREGERTIISRRLVAGDRLQSAVRGYCLSLWQKFLRRFHLFSCCCFRLCPDSPDLFIGTTENFSRAFLQSLSAKSWLSLPYDTRKLPTRTRQMRDILKFQFQLILLLPFVNRLSMLDIDV